MSAAAVMMRDFTYCHPRDVLQNVGLLATRQLPMVQVRDSFRCADPNGPIRRRRDGGDLIHHIISPTTGLPAQTCWRAVSVAAASCVDANIASTCAVIRGRPALPWLTELALPARLVSVDGGVVTVSGWPADPREEG